MKNIFWFNWKWTADRANWNIYGCGTDSSRTISSSHLNDIQVVPLTWWPIESVIQTNVFLLSPPQLHSQTHTRGYTQVMAFSDQYVASFNAFSRRVKPYSIWFVWRIHHFTLTLVLFDLAVYPVLQIDSLLHLLHSHWRCRCSFEWTYRFPQQNRADTADIAAWYQATPSHI